MMIFYAAIVELLLVMQDQKGLSLIKTNLSFTISVLLK